ncbi:hypothetical protein CHCC15543_3078 [Bacillus licheniformis]|nr:hypothetical protein CHCC15543_3078 [Bacillus licheniformis]
MENHRVMNQKEAPLANEIPFIRHRNRTKNGIKTDYRNCTETQYK